MRPLPEALRRHLSELRLCRANGITPRVLVPEEALDWLQHIDVRGGRIELSEDLPGQAIRFARLQLGAPYHAHATIHHAPVDFSCSSFVKYVMAAVGIWMPRYAADQSYQGRVLLRDAQSVEWQPGLLAFWKGEFPIRDPMRAVGHVGMICGERRLIHADSKKKKVNEFTPRSPESAIFTDPFPSDPSVLVHIPSEARGFETALDLVRWMQR
jgi:cell wall-associated NlpC family hydrolase